MSPRASRPRAAPLLAAAGAMVLLSAGGCRRRASEATGAAAAPTPGRSLPARADLAGYDFRGPERAAVDAFLSANPGLRVADDDDRRPAEGDGDLVDLYGVYHPYFVRGDVNDDGVLDFVLAFVRRDSDTDAPWFSVVLFSGRSDGAFAPGTPVERDISLADGDVSIDRDAIVVTPDTADDVSRRYRWDPVRHRHVFVHDASEESASPPPAKI